jgi:hypothetical protein
MTAAPKPPPPAPKDSLSVEVGGWFRAHATGGGVLAIPLVLLLLVAAAALRHLLP